MGTRDIVVAPAVGPSDLGERKLALENQLATLVAQGPGRPTFLELAPPRGADHPLGRTVPGGLYTMVLANPIISEQKIHFDAA